MANSGLLLWFEKILISSRPASIHWTYLLCQMCWHRLSSSSRSFSASPRLKCSSAWRRNLINTRAGNLSCCAQTQSTCLRRILTSALLRNNWLALAVEEALIRCSRQRTRSLSLGTLLVISVSVSHKTLSTVYYLNTSKFCITRLKRMWVAKAKLSLTMATKSCKITSHGRIELLTCWSFLFM